MSLYDYQQSQKISAEDYPFYALVMAAFRQADTFNLERLRKAFPATYDEFIARYNAPGGIIDE